jgi:small subunit ribosomal protein S17
MRTKTGIVTSTKMEKTIVVSVQTYKIHPKYKKRYKSTSKFYAHDENGLAHSGDTVTISETRPLSKLKRWLLIEDSVVPALTAE